MMLTLAFVATWSGWFFLLGGSDGEQRFGL